MWKPTTTRAEQQFAAAQKRDQVLIKQKEKIEKEREDRVSRLRKLRLAREEADKVSQGRGEDEGPANPGEGPTGAQAPVDAAGPAADAEDRAAETALRPRPVRFHPHRS